MVYDSIITLSEKSVENNISFLRSKFGEKVKISAVVKANAYGHGIEQMVPVFVKYGIDHFSVFYYREAVRVYNCTSKPKSIMVMGWLCDEDIKDAIEKGIEFFVFSIERLNTAVKFAKELNRKAKIHIEAETGMNRSGLDFDDLDCAIDIINQNISFVEVTGFCTHLAGAESISNHFRIQNQLKKHNEMFAHFEAKGLCTKYKHVANSAASFVYPETRMDMVRV